MRTTAPDERRYVRDLLTGRTANVEIAALIGSFARGTSIPQLSDLDLLIIGPKPGPPPPTGLHVVFLTRSDMEGRALAGDDFAQWALRFGRAIKGARAWEHLKARLSELPWPSWTKKLHQAECRAETVRQLLDMGDEWAAQEELLFALTQLSRAVLLSQRIFPLSRPELSQQLRDIGEETLASAMDELYGLQKIKPDRLHAVLDMVRERLDRKPTEN